MMLMGHFSFLFAAYWWTTIVPAWATRHVQAAFSLSTTFTSPILTSWMFADHSLFFPWELHRFAWQFQTPVLGVANFNMLFLSFSSFFTLKPSHSDPPKQCCRCGWWLKPHGRALPPVGVWSLQFLQEAFHMYIQTWPPTTPGRNHHHLWWSSYLQETWESALPNIFAFLVTNMMSSVKDYFYLWTRL